MEKELGVEQPIEAQRYVPSVTNKEFRQSEILTNLTQYVYRYDVDATKAGILEVKHRFAIIASQDCDLYQAYKSQKEAAPILNSVLLFEMRPFDELSQFVANTNFSSKERERIKQNKEERFHYLSNVPNPSASQNDAKSEAPETVNLVIDFRRLFALPLDDLVRQCGQEEAAKRWLCLADLYREHLQSRIAYYLQRVGLPSPYET